MAFPMRFKDSVDTVLATSFLKVNKMIKVNMFEPDLISVITEIENISSL